MSEIKHIPYETDDAWYVERSENFGLMGTKKTTHGPYETEMQAMDFIEEDMEDE